MGNHQSHLFQLFPLLQQVLLRVGVHKTETGARLGLTNSHLGILGSVLRNTDCTMSELAADRLVPLPAATRMVDGLVTKGFLERVADRADRRIVRLRITQPGREVIDQIHEEALATLAQVLNKMTAEEQKALITGLNAFIEAVTTIDQP
jgi:DNA-binding MarR family transcriptional regulator